MDIVWVCIAGFFVWFMIGAIIFMIEFELNNESLEDFDKPEYFPHFLLIAASGLFAPKVINRF